ncbi:hypothetical protein AM1_E0050 (plasmid) [Acaryochloris marina MBIC11017]|uniref:Uncharacterized protein n=1 Tax=Acaryochloris marina (strain MBIC 11017) TaxID=329726 RepID=A8ZP84_ACAM1|nr:hypothetical protein AM1_E0050 [Acaryochloris marina MBIC11017]
MSEAWGWDIALSLYILVSLFFQIQAASICSSKKWQMA